MGFPVLTFFATTVSSFLSIYAFNMFVLALMTAKRIISGRTRDIDPSLPDQLPVVTVQIPVYNEDSIVGKVLDNVTSLDYPKDKIQVQLLDDSTDRDLLHEDELMVESYVRKGHDIQLIHRTDRKGYKAGALNNGLRQAKGEYVVVVDADTISPSSFLKDLVPLFSEDEKLAFVQTKCDYSDRWFNWVTESSAVERDMHYLVEQPAKNWYNLLPNFSGKAGMWRRAVLDKYGWDETVITEDIELSYRVQIDGWKSIYLQNPTCLIELPPSLTALKAQQKRWTAGFAQSFRKLWRSVIRTSRLSTFQKMETLIFLSTPVTHIIALAAIVLWALAAVFEPEATLGLWLGTLAFSGFMAAMSFGAQLPVIMAVFRSGERVGRKLITIPLTLTMVTANLFANAKGAIEGFTGKRLVFERTRKYGITKSTKKHEITSDLGFGQIIRRNKVELISAILMTVFSIKILQIGQITSAIPLFYIAAAWLIGSLQK